jgi:hypothetical protein
VSGAAEKEQRQRMPQPPPAIRPAAELVEHGAMIQQSSQSIGQRLVFMDRRQLRARFRQPGM